MYKHVFVRCVCMFVCVCACVCVCVCVYHTQHLHIYTSTHIYIYTHIHIYIYKYTTNTNTPINILTASDRPAHTSSDMSFLRACAAILKRRCPSTATRESFHRGYFSECVPAWLRRAPCPPSVAGT